MHSALEYIQCLYVRSTFELKSGSTGSDTSHDLKDAQFSQPGTRGPYLPENITSQMYHSFTKTLV